MPVLRRQADREQRQVHAQVLTVFHRQRTPLRPTYADRHGWTAKTLYHATGEKALTNPRIHSIILIQRGVAQLVARMVRDHEAASSSLATSTKIGKPSKFCRFFYSRNKFARLREQICDDDKSRVIPRRLGARLASEASESGYNTDLSAARRKRNKGESS